MRVGPGYAGARRGALCRAPGTRQRLRFADALASRSNARGAGRNGPGDVLVGGSGAATPAGWSAQHDDGDDTKLGGPAVRLLKGVGVMTNGARVRGAR